MRIGRLIHGVDPEIDNEENVITPEDIRDLTPDKVIVTFSKMHYGMKDKNPLDFVKFYPKTRPNGMLYCIQGFLDIIFNQCLLECFHAQRGDLSLLEPKQFGEVLLRVYTKDVRFVLISIGCLVMLFNTLQIFWYCPSRLPLFDPAHDCAVRAY